MKLAAKWLPKSGILFLVLWSFIACSSNLPEKTLASVPNTGPSIEEKNSEVLKYEILPSLPVTLLDHLGNKVTVESVERIIPLEGSIAEIVFALGLGDKVVATDLSATWPVEADQLPQIGYQRALASEPIAAFSPTVLIGTDIAGPPKTIADLKRLGYALVIVPSEATAEGPPQKIRAVARALGVPGRGEKLAGQLEEVIAANTQKLNAASPIVAALYIRGKGTQLVLGRNSATHWLIEAAGGRNVADILDLDEYTPITAEALLSANPDVILVPSAGLESVGGIDGLLGVGGISETSAGINKAILSYDDQLLLGNGPRSGALLEQLTTDLLAVSRNVDER